MSKENQCCDAKNEALARAVDGSSARLHKAAPINGSKNGNQSSKEGGK